MRTAIERPVAGARLLAGEKARATATKEKAIVERLYLLQLGDCRIFWRPCWPQIGRLPLRRLSTRVDTCVLMCFSGCDSFRC